MLYCRGNSFLAERIAYMWAGSFKEGQDLSIDEAVFDRLKDNYINLINKWIYKACSKYTFEKRGITKFDLLQVCYVLLILAYKNYDPSRGKFSTLLVTYMKNAFAKISLELGVEKAINATDYVNYIDKSGHKIGLDLKLLACDMKPLHTINAYGELRERVNAAIESLYNEGNLDSEDIQIYRMISGGMTQIEIGEIFGVTNERIRQRLQKTIGKIQRRLRLMETL